MESKNISEILREYLIKEREKNSSLNEASISKKMNIPPTTFNRLINEYSKPNVVTILKLMQFIPELKHSLPQEIAEILKVTLKREDSQYIDGELENLLFDKNNCLCWTLASLEKGVTEEEIRSFLGVPGIKALKLLERKQIVLKQSDNYYKKVESRKNIILSFQLIKNIVHILIEYYKPDNINGNNYIHYFVNSVNKEGVKKIREIHQKVHQEIQEVINLETYRGDIPLFSLACSDVLMEREL